MPTPATGTAFSHLAWLTVIKPSLTSKDGRQIQVWELGYGSDLAILGAWAKHLREHYCLDSEIDKLRSGTGYSRLDYLIELIFPDQTKAPGPSIRAGDFAEILVADQIESQLGYWIPRWRYAEKAIRNESVKGTDIIGIRLANAGAYGPNDELLTFEVKARLTSKNAEPTLQNAVDDSVKDNLRKAYTLNAIKQRLYSAKKDADALAIERFQNASDRPFKEIRGAAAVLADGAFDSQMISSTDCSIYPKTAQVLLLVIRGSDLMTFVHALFNRAANEA